MREKPNRKNHRGTNQARPRNNKTKIKSSELFRPSGLRPSVKNPTAKAIWGTSQGHETTKPNRQCRKRQQWQSQARQKSTKNNVKTPSTFSNDAGRPQEQFFPSSEPTEEEPNRQRRLSPCKGYKPSADTKRQRKTHKSSKFFGCWATRQARRTQPPAPLRATGTRSDKTESVMGGRHRGEIAERQENQDTRFLSEESQVVRRSHTGRA